jgi:hypothetical protein
MLMAGCSGSVSVEDTIQAAGSALKKGEYVKSIEQLEPLAEKIKGGPEEGRVLFLLGKAYFQRAESKLSGLSKDARMFQGMPADIVQDLKRAHELVVDAIWISGSDDIVAEGYYIAGKTQDVGYLQDFEKARDYYKQSFSISATTEVGQKALERYSVLAEWFQMYENKDGE